MQSGFPRSVGPAYAPASSPLAKVAFSDIGAALPHFPSCDVPCFRTSATDHLAAFRGSFLRPENSGSCSRRLRPCGLDISHAASFPFQDPLSDTLGISHRPDRAHEQAFVCGNRLSPARQTCRSAFQGIDVITFNLVDSSPHAGYASRMYLPLLRRTASASSTPCALSVQRIRCLQALRVTAVPHDPDLHDRCAEALLAAGAEAPEQGFVAYPESLPEKRLLRPSTSRQFLRLPGTLEG